MFSFLPRVTQTCLSKKLYSQKTLSFPPTLTVLPHSQSAHSKKLSLSFTPFHLGLSSGHSLSDSAPSLSVSLTHSLSAAPLPSPSPSSSPLHLAPSQPQLWSLTLIPPPSPCCQLLRRLRRQLLRRRHRRHPNKPQGILI